VASDNGCQRLPERRLDRGGVAVRKEGGQPPGSQPVFGFLYQLLGLGYDVPLAHCQGHHQLGFDRPPGWACRNLNPAGLEVKGNVFPDVPDTRLPRGAAVLLFNERPLLVKFQGGELKPLHPLLRVYGLALQETI